MNLGLQHLYVLIAALCFCCKSKVADEEGVVKNYDQEGRLIQEVIYDQKDATRRIVKDYYKNGQIFQQVEYINNLKQGVVKSYYEDGTLLRETPYDSGRV